MLSSLSSSLPKQAAVDPKLMAEAKQLEGVFLNTLTSTMFSSIKTDGAFGGGFGEQTWRGMQAQEMADEISQSGGIGLADSITSNLLTAQEAANSTAINNLSTINSVSTMQGAYPQ